MNLHLNVNMNSMNNNMIYEDHRRTKNEDIVQGVSKTFSEDDDDEDLSSCSSSFMSSSSDIAEDEDDASSFSSNGPLEDLSDLMSHLPVKRGLSKFYEGRSQSFTSLANVKSLEDLMKRGFQKKNYGARKKASCRSSGMILEKRYKRIYSTKAKISKNPNKTPSTLSCLSRRRN